PRALQFFIQVLLQDSAAYGFDYLRKVMDRATPLYQERLNSLTAPQRKIVQEMAFWWEAAPTKTLVEKCRMESKLIASYLKQLEKFGIVETLQTGKKNHLYRIAERFFNMWLIVTQGNPDQKRRAKYLTLFLEAWYDEQEIRALAQQHLDVLQEGNVPYDKALVLSKGLAHSKFIGVKERDVLIDYTQRLCVDGQEDSELPRKYETIKNEIDQLWEAKHYEDALVKVEEIENEEDGVKFFMKGYCYQMLQEYKNAEVYYLRAIEKGHVNAFNNLGNIYQDMGKIVEAKQKYSDAIKKGNVNALNNLAALYSEQGERVKAEQYFLEAIDKGHIEASYNLAVLYSIQGKSAEAEQYYLKAIDKGNANALNNLAIIYFRQGKNIEAEQYYLQAIEKGNVVALYNLAGFYAVQGKASKAVPYFLKAIEKGHTVALFNLAGLYYETIQNPTEALAYIQQYFVKTGDEKCFKNLIILEIWNGIFDNLHEKIERVIQNKQDDDLTWFFTNLLYHQQTQLVLSLFESEQHGKTLKTRYELLYYATLILAKKTEDNLLLRIPPEVLPTVEAIVAGIKAKQEFYRTPVSG
ncbi:MAG: sel1 repeat family protein, partial [Saprospiraceae bacterium]|nr:sel1 repeat family protein [Saprospiraceae bacterium]